MRIFNPFPKLRQHPFHYPPPAAPLSPTGGEFKDGGFAGTPPPGGEFKDGDFAGTPPLGENLKPVAV